jgi:hypothetical protein
MVFARESRSSSRILRARWSRSRSWRSCSDSGVSCAGPDDGSFFRADDLEWLRPKAVDPVRVHYKVRANYAGSLLAAPSCNRRRSIVGSVALANANSDAAAHPLRVVLVRLAMIHEHSLLALAPLMPRAFGDATGHTELSLRNACLNLRSSPSANETSTLSPSIRVISPSPYPGTSTFCPG